MGQAIDVYEAGWAALGRGDLDGYTATLAEDVDFRMPGLPPIKGKAAVGGLMEAYLRAFPDLRHQVTHVIESGGELAIQLNVNGTHTGTLSGPGGDIPATGRKVVWDSCDIVRVENGKVKSWTVYFDNAAFLTQLGLMPSPAGT